MFWIQCGICYEKNADNTGIVVGDRGLSSSRRPVHAQVYRKLGGGTARAPNYPVEYPISCNVMLRMSRRGGWEAGGSLLHLGLRLRGLGFWGSLAGKGLGIRRRVVSNHRLHYLFVLSIIVIVLLQLLNCFLSQPMSFPLSLQWVPHFPGRGRVSDWLRGV